MLKVYISHRDSQMFCLQKLALLTGIILVNGMLVASGQPAGKPVAAIKRSVSLPSQPVTNATTTRVTRAVSLPNSLPNYSFPNFGKKFLGTFAETDWQVTQSTWKPLTVAKDAFSLDAIKDQFRKDVILWSATIIKQPLVNGKIAGKQLEKKHIDKLGNTQAFLKRWVLTLAACPLMYVTSEHGKSSNNASSLAPQDPNYQDLKPFPFPLASALSHGQRMIVELLDITYDKMYNLLLSGDQNLKPTIDFKRAFASHQVSDTKYGQLIEDKVIAGLSASIRGNHCGVNVPLGGSWQS